MKKYTTRALLLICSLTLSGLSGCSMGTLGGSSSGVDEPEDLSVSPLSSSEIVVSWSDVSEEEEGYTIERAADSSGSPGAWTTLASLGANTESYTNSGLSEATRYWYRVYARGSDDNDSSKTDEKSAETRLAEPLTLTAIAASSTSVDLEWADRSSSEEGYKIERADDNGGSPGAWAQIVDLLADSASHQDTTGLSASTTYWYRIYAYSSLHEDSNYTSQVSVTTD